MEEEDNTNLISQARSVQAEDLPHLLRDVSLTRAAHSCDRLAVVELEPVEAAKQAVCEKLTEKIDGSHVSAALSAKQRALVSGALAEAVLSKAEAEARARAKAAAAEADGAAEQRTAARSGLRLTEARPVPTVAEVVEADAAARAKTAGHDAPEVTDEDVSAARWWDNFDPESETVSFSSVDWAGPAFPAVFEGLPDSVQFRYAGQVVQISAEMQEMAVEWAKIQHLEWPSKPRFRSNFWEAFTFQWTVEPETKPDGAPELCSLDEADFSDYFAYHEQVMERNKRRTAAERRAVRAVNAAERQTHGFALLDGHRVELGSWRIEPPGLFRGRGEHPKAGYWKPRVTAEEVILNWPAGQPLPPVPADGGSSQWGGREWAPDQMWLAKWTDVLTGSMKYVRLGNTSAHKGVSDLTKFERARRLAGCVDDVRAAIALHMRSARLTDRQTGLIAHLIDRFAIRPGGDKNTAEEADTVGATSLRVEHIGPVARGSAVVRLDFLGKDSVRFVRETTLDALPLSILNESRAGKRASEKVFDATTPSQVNQFLSSLMPGLTAKVFRTFNASSLLDKMLFERPEAAAAGSVADRYAFFNEANLEVARLCNHQRNVGAAYGSVLGNADKRILLLERQLAGKQLEHAVLAARLHQLGGSPAGWSESELLQVDVEACEAKLTALAAAEATDQAERRHRLAVNKFARENGCTVEEARAEVDAPAPAPKQLRHPTTIRQATAAEHAARKALLTQWTKLHVEHHKLREKEGGASLATSTSRVNYIDPRIVVAWSRRVGVPVTRVMPRTLLVKFLWALEATPNWRFRPGANAAHDPRVQTGTPSPSPEPAPAPEVEPKLKTKAKKTKVSKSKAKESKAKKTK